MGEAKCKRCRKRKPKRPSVYCAKTPACNELRKEDMVEREEKRKAEGEPRTRAEKKRRGVVVSEIGGEYPAAALSGIVHKMKVGEKVLPKMVPRLDSSNTGIRVLILNRDNENGAELQRVVKEEVMGWDEVNSAVVGEPLFVSANVDGMQKERGGVLSEAGVIHRDVVQKKMCRMTASAPMESYASGGIEIWRDSEDCLPGRTRADEDFGGGRIKDLGQQLNRRFKRETWSVKKGEVLLFDSRLWHRSLVHRDNIERHALTFVVGINGTPKMHFKGVGEEAKGWMKRN